ncbi:MULTISPECIES: hypothetical protein [unclassified Caulobacter]|uniref:hypothetical protein n=1 Tax=unclassified Caulobacter TaxID=2648921 RepID=UPI000D391258|nr:MULTISPECIES: hypothetical protein [unclassified Caulobacter]PTT05694.1 hypothetical protein DBR10_14810 [Caulobacter sp. HMWF025]PTT79130.1 hypothetical protein DBR41_22195 [Pseudomonas sp. HMWF010]
MTAEQIATAVQALHEQAGEHEGLKPGLITVHADNWVAMSPRLPALCTIPALGIRHRGIRVIVSRQEDNRVLTRDEAGQRGEPFLDLEPPTA